MTDAEQLATVIDGWTSAVNIPGLVDAVYAPDALSVVALGTGPNGARVSRVDPLTLTIAGTVLDVPGIPVAVAFMPDRESIAVLTSAPNVLTIARYATGEVSASISLPDAPTGMAVSPNGLAAFVTSAAGHSVHKVSLASGDVERTLDVTGSPGDIVINPHGDKLWVADAAGPAVLRLSADTLAATPIALPPGAQSLTDLELGRNPLVVLAVDQFAQRIYATSEIDTSFYAAPPIVTGAQSVSPVGATSAVDAVNNVTAGLTIISRYTLGSTGYELAGTTNVPMNIRRIIRPPLIAPRVSAVMAPGSTDTDTPVTLTPVVGDPAPASLRWNLGGVEFTTGVEPLTYVFPTGGPIAVSVTGVAADGTTGEASLYDGKAFVTVGNASTARTTVQVNAVLKTIIYDFDSTDTAQYVDLPADAVAVRVTAAGAPGAAGKSTTTYDGDTGGQTLNGGHGGAGLSVSTTIPVGEDHLVAPGDRLGIVIDGSSGNLLGGVGGGGDGAVAGHGGRGGNGSGVFLADGAAVHPWLVIGSGGGGGGGNAGFLLPNAEPWGGPGALTLEDTRGHGSESGSWGDPGIAPAYCLDASVTGSAREFHQGPYTAGFGQDGNPGADGATASSAGGGGGGGAGCQGGLGARATGAGGGAGSGGGGGVGFSRFPITDSGPSTHAHVHLEVDYWQGGVPRVWFDAWNAHQIATAGVPVCFPLSLSRNAVADPGPMVLSGLPWLTVTRLDAWTYTVCGTPARGSDAGAFTLTAASWGASASVDVAVLVPAIAVGPYTPDARVGTSVTIPLTVSGFQRADAVVTATGLPPGLELVDGAAGPEIRGTFAAGSEGDWDVTVTAANGSVSAQAPLGFHVTSLADAALSMSSEVSGVVGDAMRIEVTLANAGADPAVGQWRIALAADAGVDLVSISGAGWTCVPTACTTTTAATPPGPVTATVRAAAVGTYSISAHLTVPFDVDESNNTVTTAIAALAPPVTQDPVTEDPVTQDPVAAGPQVHLPPASSSPGTSPDRAAPPTAPPAPSPAVPSPAVPSPAAPSPAASASLQPSPESASPPPPSGGGVNPWWFAAAVVALGAVWVLVRTRHRPPRV